MLPSPMLVATVKEVILSKPGHTTNDIFFTGTNLVYIANYSYPDVIPREQICITMVVVNIF